MTSTIPDQRPCTPLLDAIDFPNDLRRLPREQLPALARELRQFLLYTVGQTGGHLGAGLGVVELTITLHYVFNTPEDRLVWDVGHQCYPHKILTGRREQMATLRQRSGLCGFPDRSESDYDCFGTGHSSTSVSAALGMAIALAGKDSDRQAIAVIGDGAMTAGQAFEALNHAACVNANILVILNDNDMSISPSVGMLARYLRGIETSRTNQNKQASAPVLFEDQGFAYTGPMDGHNLEQLIETLSSLKQQTGPRLLHIVTRKGKGYPAAEQDPVGYHALTKITPAKTEPKPKKNTYANIFGQWLCHTAAKDKRLYGITPAMREGSDLVRFSQQFPDRYFDVAIAEQHAVTFAAGLASEGMKPVLAIYSTFLQRGYDQLIHDVALQNLDVLFAIDRAGLVGEDGPTHHGAFDIAYLRCIPNMVIMTPSNEQELWRMLNSAYQHSGPVAVRYPRGSGNGLPVEQTRETLPFGKGRITRQGKDIALVVFGTLHNEAMAAAEQLNATVADMRFAKPLDTELLTLLSDTHPLLVTVEDGVTINGAGAGVEACIRRTHQHIEMLTLGLPDHFIHHQSRAEQLSRCGLDCDGIIKQVEEHLGRSDSCSDR